LNIESDFMEERCKVCGGRMYQYENKAYNEAFAVKMWGWRCEQCWRTIDEIKPIEGVRFI